MNRHSLSFKKALVVTALLSSFSHSVFAEPSTAHSRDVTVAFSSDPTSLDPYEQLSAGMMQYDHLVFDPLVRIGKGNKIYPRLAKKWQQVSPTVLRFYLHQGVKFHSGNTMNADDVIWSYQRLIKAPDFKGLFSNFIKMVKVDDYTVELIAKSPSPILINTATKIFVMDSKFYTGKDKNGQDKSALIKAGQSFASTHESGTGPFKVTAREQGIATDFARFADYWDKETGNVEHLHLKVIKQNATRVAALLSGGVDFIAPLAPNDISLVKKHNELQLVRMTSDRGITLQLNQATNPAFKDKRVREAVVYAINSTAIAKRIMSGAAKPIAQMSPQEYVGYNPELTSRYDLNKAKQLMKEAGYEKGFKATFIAPNNRYPNDAKVAQAAAVMLAKIGIKVELKTMPKAQYWPEFDKCNGDILMLGWSSDTLDSANYLEFLNMTRDEKTGLGQYNCGGYSNPEVDSRVILANKTFDLKKRTQLLQEAETILYHDAAFVPLYAADIAWAANQRLLNLKDLTSTKEYTYFGDLKVQ